jgi:hypothetical protein
MLMNRQCRSSGARRPIVLAIACGLSVAACGSAMSRSKGVNITAVTAPPAVPVVTTTTVAPTPIPEPRYGPENEGEGGTLSPYENSIEKLFTRTPQPSEPAEPWNALKEMKCLAGLEPIVKLKRSVVLGGPEVQARAVWFRGDTEWGDVLFIVTLPYSDGNPPPTPEEFRASVAASVDQVNKAVDQRKPSDQKRDTSEVIELRGGGVAKLSNIARDEKWVGLAMVPGPCSVRIDLPATTDREKVVGLLEALSAWK